MYSPEDKVKWLAITSRIVVVLLQAIFNGAIPDHNAGVFMKPFDNNETFSLSDKAVSFLFGGLSRWDAQYFLHIAQYGYTYENTLAFFPFFPLLTRQLSNIAFYLFNKGLLFIFPWMEPISIHSSILITAIIFNNVIFVKTAMTLFSLSCVVLKNTNLSYVSSVLFCVNPASIFFSAAYSESVYCFLVMHSLLRMEERRFLLSSVLFGLSAVTRSNGIVNVGFICYSYLKLSADRKASFLDFTRFSIFIIISIIPFTLHQLYCYAKYCFPGEVSLPHFIRSYGIENGFTFPGNGSAWCDRAIPLAYSFVQAHYWQVGFLTYYQLKQLPNFALALPVLVIVAHGCVSFAKDHGTSLFYLGFARPPRRTQLPHSAFVYVAHCLFLSVFSTFFIHIQVTTRLLHSSTPVVYWFAACILAGGIRNGVPAFVSRNLRKSDYRKFFEMCENRRSRWKTFLLTESFRGSALFLKYYYILYLLLGTLMFPNFLPWT